MEIILLRSVKCKKLHYVDNAISYWVIYFIIWSKLSQMQSSIILIYLELQNDV